jgi:hypothetical protein
VPAARRAKKRPKAVQNKIDVCAILTLASPAMLPYLISGLRV